MEIIFLSVVILAAVPVCSAQPIALAFAQGQYNAAENQDVEIQLFSQLSTSGNFSGHIAVEVEVGASGSRGCKPGEDFTLSNSHSNIATVTFLPFQDDSSTFRIMLRCDRILEGPEICIIRVRNVSIPKGAPVTDGGPDSRPSVTLTIDNCPGVEVVQCSWEKNITNVTEGAVSSVVLYAICTGRFSIDISIGVTCSGNTAQTGETVIRPADEGSDWSITNGTTLRFTESEEERSRSTVPIFVQIINDTMAETRESLICILLATGVDEVQAVEPNQVTITIQDDDELEVKWAKKKYIYNENDGSATVELVTTSEFEFSVNIVGIPGTITEGIPGVLELSTMMIEKRMGGFTNITVVNFEGQVYGVGEVTRFISGSDIRMVRREFPFNDMQKSSKGNFSIVNDGICEYDELVMATFEFGAEVENTFNARQGDPNVTYIVIKDDDSVTIGFPYETSTVAESAGSVDIHLRIDGRFFVPITATVTCVSDNATMGMDFINTTATVTFPVAAAANLAQSPTNSTPITIKINNDSVPEEEECFTCSITNYTTPCNVRLGSITKTKICIPDDDVQVRFDPDLYNAKEGVDDHVTITLVALQDHEYAFNVTVISKAGTAALGEDYSGETFNVLFPAGVNIASFNVTILDDRIAECPEEFFLDLKIPPAAQLMGVARVKPYTATVNITDEDVITVSFSPQNYTVPEGTPAELMIVSDEQSVKNITVTVTTMDISAESPGDYMSVITDVTIVAGQRMGNRPVSVPTNQDTIKENSEHFKAILSLPERPSNVVVGVDTAFVTIIDGTVPVRFNPDIYFVTEGVDTHAIITLEALVNHTFDFTVTVITRDGSAARVSDYLGEVYTVLFRANENTVNFQVPIVNDEVGECPEDFFLDLVVPAAAAAMGVIKGIPDNATVNIADEDAVTVSFSPQNYTVPESSPAELMIVLDKQSAKDITCNVTTMDITAQSPIDYIGGAYPITIQAGIVKAILPVPTNSDIICEDDEYFKATITCDPTPIDIEIGPDAFVTITDATVPVQFNPTVYTVTEGNGIVTVTMEALRDHDFEFVVNVSTTDGTAKSGSDYGGPQMITVTFPARDNSVDFTIPIVNNEIAECPENFSLQLVIPQSAADLGVVTKSDDTALVNIRDDDVVTISFSPQNYTVPEGTPAEIMIVLDRESVKEITCTMTTMDGTAESSNDYIGGTFQVTFPVGVMKVTQHVEINTDTFCETDEYFKATLSCDPTLVATAIGPDAFVTITDATVPVQFNPTVYTVTERDDNVATVMLEALRNHDFDFMVNVSTIDGTAKRESDYDIPEMITVMFPAGQNNVAFNISIVDNEITECPENFTLQLVIPKSAADLGVVTKSDDTAVVNIMDDDELLISFDPTGYQVKENEGPVNITIRASRLAEFAYIISLSTHDGSAIANTDYVPGPFEVEFLPGTTHVTQPISIVDDNILENIGDNNVYNGLEHFLCRMDITEDLLQKGVMVETTEARVNITDNDVVVFFEREAYETDESVDPDSISIVVLAQGDLSSPFTIPLEATGGTATRDLDYRPLPDNVMFASSVTSMSFPFGPICDQQRNEGLETAILAISVQQADQDHITLGALSSTTVTINDTCPGTPVIRVNDTVIADPVFTVPISTQNFFNSTEGFPMCYDVHGRNDTYFNFVSDNCASVNAYYALADDPKVGNVIREIGIVATDNDNDCHYMRVAVVNNGSCVAMLDGQVPQSGRYNSSGITFNHKNGFVRISVPNCAPQTNLELVMWINCKKLVLGHRSRVEQPLIKFVICRGLSHRPQAHGLIGQFWGVPFTVEPWTTADYYNLTMCPENGPKRSFIAHLGHSTWSLKHAFAMPDSKCLYVGNSQGGRDPLSVDSTIEGDWPDYITTGLYDIKWKYNRYTEDTCPP